MGVTVDNHCPKAKEIRSGLKGGANLIINCCSVASSIVVLKF